MAAKFLTKKNILATLKQEHRLGTRSCPVSACFVDKGLFWIDRSESSFLRTKYEGVMFDPSETRNFRKPSLVNGEYLAAMSLKFETLVQNGAYYEDARKKVLSWVKRVIPENYREKISG